MIPEQYLGMVIVGIFTISSSVITIVVNHILTERREKRRRREEYRQKRIDAAHEYFRRIYDYLAPCLSMYYEAPVIATVMKTHFGGPKKIPMKKKEKEMVVKVIKSVHDRISQAITVLGEKGYLGLLPAGLYSKIMQLYLKAIDCDKIIQKDPTLSDITEEQISNFNELLELCKDIRTKIRRLLNVDALTV